MMPIFPWILHLVKFPILDEVICHTIFAISTQIIFLPLTFTKEAYLLYAIESHVVSDKERLWAQTNILFIVPLTQAMIEGHEHKDRDPWPPHGRVLKGVLFSEMGTSFLSFLRLFFGIPCPPEVSDVLVAVPRCPLLFFFSPSLPGNSLQLFLFV